jgi:hypothetical protein
LSPFKVDPVSPFIETTLLGVKLEVLHWV